MDPHRLTEKFGIYFDDVGLNKTYGRMFGFFMTAAHPVSMGQLVEALKISKSTASIELRRLLTMGVIEKVLLPDQRADFYQLKHNLWSVHLEQKMHDIQKLRAIIEAIPTDELAGLAQLKEMARYCAFMETELAELINKYAKLTNEKKTHGND